MPLYKSSNSSYWQIRFEIAGVEVRRSSRTRDRHAAQELEKQLQDELWRQIKLGEQRWTWGDAVAKFTTENSGQRSWDRTKRSLDVLNEFIANDDPLAEVDYGCLLKIRSLLEVRACRGNGWKTKRMWKKSTCNRVLAVAGAILNRCASDDWKKMIPSAPNIPLFQLDTVEPKWITREQAHVLLGRFPVHTRDMVIFALATGLRKSNVAGLEWDRIDMERRCCFVPGYLTKSGEPIPVPLNDDAHAVLERWQTKHDQAGDRWSPEVHQYVFVYRRRAPIQKVTTAMWRRECKAVGLEKVTFHSMRHAWASWQTQAGTPLRMLQELGGWANLQMPQRYSHLDPGHLAEYASRTLLGPDSRKESVKVGEDVLGNDPQVFDYGGKGGTRTLDPGIMSAVL